MIKIDFIICHSCRKQAIKDLWLEGMGCGLTTFCPYCGEVLVVELKTKFEYMVSDKDRKHIIRKDAEKSPRLRTM